MTISEKLLQIKQTLDKKRRERDEAKGALATVEAQLKDKFGVESPEQAQELIDELQGKAAELESSIADGVAKLESKLGAMA